MTRAALLGSVFFVGGVVLATGACSSSGDTTASGDGGGDDATVDEGGSAAEGGSIVDGGKDANFGAAGCGRNTTKCADGKPCDGPPDCVSGICRNNVCASPDMTMDASSTETDVGCGGPNAPACGDGKKCKVADDCTSVICTMGICQAPTCTDGKLNGAETAKDCGGGTCPLCADGSTCKTGTADCKSGVCTGNICQVSACSDTIKNGTETDVDCGGTCPGKCATGLTCAMNTDCASSICNSGTKKCTAPSPTDTVQNGGETDTDCGGALQADGTTNPMADGAPKCGVGKKCALHYDCTTDGCDYTGHCVIAPSCAPHYGGDTCGAGETGTGAANGENHESCCASIPLPGNTVKVDKYEITAGRMREFLKRTNNNVYAWYQTWKAANPTKVAAVGIRAADEQYLPQDVDKPYLPNMNWNDCPSGSCPPNAVAQHGPAIDMGHTAGVYDHLGNTVFFADSPSDYQGCYVGRTEYADGHPTYWWDDATQINQWGAGPRAFSQAQLDEKSLNCVTQIILAAFCAWDGGRLPTFAELANASSGANSAWGSGTYPWGNTPSSTDTWTTNVPGRVNPLYTSCDAMGNCTNQTNPGVFSVNMPINDGTGHANLLAPTYNTTNWNQFYPVLPGGLRYYWPELPLGHCQDAADPNYLSTCPLTGLPAGKTCPTNCGWGQNDEAYNVAAPGRFINDKRAVAPMGAHDGWFDLAANVMEATSDGTNTDSVQHDSLPTKYWVGGSFEGHGVSRSNFQFNILTKYGKMGGRCAR